MRKIFPMKQCLLALFVLSSACLSLKAQNSIGATLNYGIANDDLGKAAKNGYGATLQARHHFDEYISAGIDVGYMTFENKKSDSKVSPMINGERLNVIPVTAVCELHFNNEKLKPFFALDLGWAHANLLLPTGAKSFVIVAPQIGVDYTVSESFCLRLSVKDNVMIYNRLEGGSDLMSYVGINLGGYIILH